MSAFQEIAALLSLSALLGMLAVRLRQPLISPTSWSASSPAQPQ